MDSLQALAGVPRDIRLREITGHEELAVDRTDSHAAIDLLGRLGCGKRALQLTAFERDRLLALIHARCYGERIDSTLTCAACSKPFDISFSLVELMRSQGPAQDGSRQADGSYCTPDGIRFRLPTGEDELYISHLCGEQAELELLRRCVIEAPGGFDPHAVQQAMERVAPLLDVDLTTHCSECQTPAKLRFDLQTFLLQSLIQDRQRLWREIHALANSYKWGLDEILNLRRLDRRMLVSLIQSSAPGRMV